VAGTASVSSFSAGTTGLTPNTATTGAVTLAGTLATTNGGTGLTSFTSGGVVYASSSSALATGSGFVFDGTNLGVGNASPQALLHVGSVVEAPGFGTTSQMSYVNGTSQPEVLVRQTTNDVVVSMYADSTGGAIRTATNHPLSFITNNSERMRLDSSGNLGIGSTNPTQKLYVSSSGNSQGQFITSGAGGGANRASVILSGPSNTWFLTTNGSDINGSDEALGFYGNSATRMVINNTGNVGIGTSSPAGRLHVVNSSGASAVVADGQNAASSGGVFILRKSGVDTGYLGQASVILGGGSTSNDLLLWSDGATNQQFYTNSAERMRITSAGNVGMGTTDPDGFSSKLAVVGNISVAAGNKLRLWDSSNVSLVGIGCPAANTMAFYTADAGTERARIDSNGNFGIGTSSPGARLDVDGSIIGQAVLTLNSANTPTLSQSSNKINLTGAGTSLDGIYMANDGGTFVIAMEGSSGNQAVSATPYASGMRTIGATPLVFGTNNAERARITSGGECLFGTTSGLNSATITAQSSNTCANLITSTSAEYSLNAWNQATSGDNNFILFQTESSPTTRGTINYNRGAGLVAYNVTSDYRAKDISGPVTGSGELIDSVPVYMGTMKGATQERPMFIAHETPAYAHTGVKDAVDKDGNPVYQQMDASALIPVMWAEIQSLRKRLADAGI
jgi:hypothetical protein